MNMHFMLIRMICAPVRLGKHPPLQPGQDELTTTQIVKHRLARFFNGEWEDLYNEASENVTRPMKLRSAAELQYVKSQKIERKARNGSLQEAMMALSGSGLLSLAEEGVREQLRELNTPPVTPPPIPPPPQRLQEDEKFEFQMGQTTRTGEKGNRYKVDTFKLVMSRLRRYKAQGPPGDRYEHYKHIPDYMMRAMIDRCLNDRLPDGFREVYADGLIHAGDKGKLDKKGRQAARPIVVGSALRRITGRVPCAQLGQELGGLFSAVRQLGVSIPSGLEVAYHTVRAGIDQILEYAEGDDDEMPVALQFDFENGFNRVSRARMIGFCEQYMPSLLRYTRLLYDRPASLHCVHNGRLLETI